MASSATTLGPSLTDLCPASQFLVFMSLVNELIFTNEKISGSKERITPVDIPDDVYDFVVIGGGAGGAVVASRLSENPDWKVMLIEAGGDEPASAQVPLFMGKLIRSKLDWNLTTSHEANACLATKGSCPLSSGKVLGGSTARNAMIYLRGVPEDYNSGYAKGNDGWAWNDVLPYFLRSEDNGEIERVGTKHHATGGPLRVERYPYVPPIGSSILAAAEEVGYGVSEDLNGDQITGFSILQNTNYHGVRRSAARAYLWPARDRENLHISLNSYVTKVLVKNHTAVGVEYFKDGKLRTIHVTHEVILSAGTMKSPQVLLLSGIGPEGHLKSMGIDLVKHLPGVGENYHDHMAYDLDFTINEPDYYDDDKEIANKYAEDQTGPLSGLGLIQVAGRLYTSLASPNIPNVQLTFGGYTAPCATGEVGALASSGKRVVGIHATNIHPRSRGTVRLASNDPFKDPVIQGNYFSDPLDQADALEAIDLALALADTKALKAHNFTLSSQPLAACSQHAFPSKAYWSCAIHQNGRSQHHEGGSCKMGRASDTLSVVDNKLRVHGIPNLRIADASVMPEVTSGNIAAPVMMIGERCANFIKKHYGYDD